MFPLRTRVAVVAATFVVLLVVQSAAAWTMRETASRGIRDALGTELETIGRSATSVLSAISSRATTVAEWSTMLRRIREAHHLEDILLIAGDSTIVADPRGAAAGTPSSIFACNPRLVSEALGQSTPLVEPIRLLGNSYRRLYVPITRGPSVEFFA